MQPSSEAKTANGVFAEIFGALVSGGLQAFKSPTARWIAFGGAIFGAIGALSIGR
jgi:hypothetical protein